MTSGRRAWQCLLTREIPQEVFHDLLPPAARNLRGCRQHHAHAQSFLARLRTSPRSMNQRSYPYLQRCAHWKPYAIGQHVRDQACMRDLDITYSYQELRNLIAKGDYTHIRNCVKTLVKERSQKPNLRLYYALLLANTDTQHGSAGEVARILEEIASEGLVPDSATYHAALRVGKSAGGTSCG